MRIKVISDSEGHGVETRYLNEQVRCNIDKFSDDFMFQLTKDEFDNVNRHLRHQVITGVVVIASNSVLPCLQMSMVVAMQRSGL